MKALNAPTGISRLERYNGGQVRHPVSETDKTVFVSDKGDLPSKSLREACRVLLKRLQACPPKPRAVEQATRENMVGVYVEKRTRTREGREEVYFAYAVSYPAWENGKRVNKRTSVYCGQFSTNEEKLELALERRRKRVDVYIQKRDRAFSQQVKSRIKSLKDLIRQLGEQE